MQTPITIDRYVPMPEAKPRSTKYPFREMEVGDSFALPVSAKARIVSSASHMGSRLGLKFTVRTVADQVRVWRVA